MASIVSKVARAAAVACRRASPTAVGGGKRHISPWPLPLRRVYLPGRRMCSDAGKNTRDQSPSPPLSSSSDEEDDADDHEATRDPRTDLRVRSAEALESDETLWALYEHCCKQYDLRRDPAQMKRRFRTFKRKAKYVHRVNNDPGTSFTVALNMFADMTLEEVKRGYGGFCPDLLPSTVDTS